MSIADIRLGLRAYLLADSAISTVVGGARVYPLKLPQGMRFASIVYTRISGQGDHHMQGASGLARPRIQIDAWAPTADAAVALANLIKERIDGFRGSMPYGSESPQASIAVQGIFLENEREDYDAEVDLHRSSKDYSIWFAER